MYIPKSLELEHANTKQNGRNQMFPGEICNRHPHTPWNFLPMLIRPVLPFKLCAVRHVNEIFYAVNEQLIFEEGEVTNDFRKPLITRLYKKGDKS